MDSVNLLEAAPIISDIAAAIVEHAAWLSEIDGAIGDGDHGINMSKGFRRAVERLGPNPPDLAQASPRLARRCSTKSAARPARFTAVSSSTWRLR